MFFDFSFVWQWIRRSRRRLSFYLCLWGLEYLGRKSIRSCWKVPLSMNWKLTMRRPVKSTSAHASWALYWDFCIFSSMVVFLSSLWSLWGLVVTSNFFVPFCILIAWRRQWRKERKSWLNLPNMPQELKPLWDCGCRNERRHSLRLVKEKIKNDIIINRTLWLTICIFLISLRTYTKRSKANLTLPPLFRISSSWPMGSPVFEIFAQALFASPNAFWSTSAPSFWKQSNCCSNLTAVFTIVMVELLRYSHWRHQIWKMLVGILLADSPCDDWYIRARKAPTWFGGASAGATAARSLSFWQNGRRYGRRYGRLFYAHIVEWYLVCLKTTKETYLKREILNFSNKLWLMDQVLKGTR